MKKQSAISYLGRHYTQPSPTDHSMTILRINRPKKGSQLQFFIVLSVFIILSMTLDVVIFNCEAQESAGQLVFSKGTVLFSLDKGNSWSPVKPSMDFPEGSYIKVESDGEAALMLNDRSQIRLSAGSVLYLKKNGSAPDEEVKKNGILEMFSGKLWFRNKRKGSKPVFQTPVISASIRGTEMALSVADDGRSDITVLEGQVKCTNSKGNAVISRGEGVTAQKGTAPVITKLLKPEKSVQWLLLTPDIIGPADAQFLKNYDSLKTDTKTGMANAQKSSVDFNAITVAQKAMEFLVSGDDRALQTSQNAVRLGGGRAATNVALATVLQSKGKFQEALKAAERAVTLDPLSVPAMIRYVELLLGLDKIGQAEQMVFSFNSSDIRVDMLKGYILLIKLDSEGAEKEFRRVVERKNNLASGYLGLGLALYHQKKTAEALENMEKACLLEPLAAYPHTYLAKAQYELGERSEAEVELKRAATLDPYDPTPHMYLATILSDTYRPGEGIKSLEKSISLNDNQLMTRSRYLLDQDRASRNISLAWSLATMGLYEWADAKGDKAVWDDESNSSAYLFRVMSSKSLRQVGTGNIGDMKRADLLKPVNSNTYTSYNSYQNLLETPEIKGSITLNGGSGKTGKVLTNLTGGNSTTAFNVSLNSSSTDGPIDNSGKSYSEGVVSTKKTVASGHEILAEARLLKGDMEDILPWQDSHLQPADIDKDYDLLAGSLGYHWHQGAGEDMMVLLQSQKYDDEQGLLSQKYISPIIGTLFNEKNSMDKSDTLRAEMVQLAKFSNQSVGDHMFSAGMARSENRSSWSSESLFYYDSPLNFADLNNSNGDNPDKKESRLFVRDIWSLSDTFMFDLGVAWANLENIILNDEKKFEDRDEWLPHLGFIWQLSSSDTIRGGYFKESEPQYLSGTLQPVEMAGFSRLFGSSEGTLTEFYGAGWDRQWSSQIFTRAEFYHKDRIFPGSFTSHAGNAGTTEENINRSWSEERQDIARLNLEYLITDRLAMALTYQFTDHNTESGVDRNRVDNDFGAIFTWVHPSGVRLQNGWWYMNQNEKVGYINPVDEEFIIASISAEKSLFDKRLLLVAKWENIFDEKYTYLVSDTIESSQLPWQGSFVSLGLQWNF